MAPSARFDRDALLADTPEPPYVAVIFTAIGSEDQEGYEDTLRVVRTLAEQQPGFLGIESGGGGAGVVEVTVSYWRTERDASAWKAVTEHAAAQRVGRDRWLADYRVRIASVERAYGPR